QARPEPHLQHPAVQPLAHPGPQGLELLQAAGHIDDPGQDVVDVDTHGPTAYGRRPRGRRHSPHGGTHLEALPSRCGDAGGAMRTAQPVVELDQIEREYAAVIALLDRSAAF